MDGPDNERVIRSLYEISTRHEEGLASQVQQMLQVGCERFGLEIGILARVGQGTFTLEHLRGPEGFPLAPGDVLPLEQTYAAVTLEAGEAVGFAHLGASALKDHPAFTHWQLESYIGVPVRLDGQDYGTLSFSSRRPRPDAFPRSDLDILQLMASWLGTELSRCRKEEDLRKAEENFRLGIEASPTAVIMVDQGGVISYLNHESLRLFGYEASDLLGVSIETLVPEAFRTTHPGLREGYMRRPYARPMGAGLDLVARRGDGREIPVQVGLNPIDTPYGSYILCTVIDLTERKQFEQKILEQTEKLQRINETLTEQALSDPLTGLANRRGLYNQMEPTLRLARRSGQPTSLLIADLDNFKEYNDAFGHPAGDRALQEIGGVLLATARRSDVVARYGGEEFVIFLPETGAAGASDLAGRIRGRVESLGSLERAVTLSVGVATLVEAPADTPVLDLADRLIQEADQALYRAKQGGRNRVVHFRDPT